MIVESWEPCACGGSVESGPSSTRGAIYVQCNRCDRYVCAQATDEATVAWGALQRAAKDGQVRAIVSQYGLNALLRDADAPGDAPQKEPTP